ncbi:MAG: nucleoside diphosphate kinase regulator [Myxococcaceae bacterium]
MAPQRRITLTQPDLERLQRLVDQHGAGRHSELAEMLEVELARAEVVHPDQLSPDVVTMNSTVVFEDEETSERREVTLCYPHEASSKDGRVSVLAPVGSALIGLAVGDSIEWDVPNGHKRFRIVAVPYQPQASARHDAPPKRPAAVV